MEKGAEREARAGKVKGREGKVPLK